VRDLVGRTALLTGASSGLGPLIARRLHREGLRLILTARRLAELEALARELVGSRVLTADLSRRGEAEWLVGAAGEVDILVANAGVAAGGPLIDFDVDRVDQALEVNLRAPIVLSRLLLPGMLERRSGHIVLMASMAGQIPGPNSSLYSTTKFGLRGFGHSMHGELRGTGVGVSLISPTFVREAGIFAESGRRAPGLTVSPGQVAEACVRAIKHNRAEVTVAPIYARIGKSFGLAAPALATMVRSRLTDIPTD
jgi:short-subunit dehydrogenase